MTPLPQINFLQNYFFEVFTIDHPVFGSISLGYFLAFKEILKLPSLQQNEVLFWLSELFKNSTMVGGDLNSTPATVSRLLSQLNIKAIFSEQPTYLFSADINSPSSIPCFDNFLVFDPSISISTLSSLIHLPATTSKNPRILISELGSPSDHVPVVCTFKKDNQELALGSYNVADPHYWGQFYPSATDGFDLMAEQTRLHNLEYLIDQLVSTCDFVSLLEVPADFADSLKSRYPKRQLNIQPMLKTDKLPDGSITISPHQPPEISRLVLIY